MSALEEMRRAVASRAHGVTADYDPLDDAAKWALIAIAEELSSLDDRFRRVTDA